MRVDALIDVAVALYGPVPKVSLGFLLNRIRYAVPHWRGELLAAKRRALARLSSATVDGVQWFWPAGERVTRGEADDQVRLLAPFDPVVWDRRRFELFWGWAYRFEAYTPLAKRKLGYYALPMLWRDRVIGWANVSMVEGAPRCAFGYAGAEPSDPVFRRELEAEVERLRQFL
jgi:uncharacterized protein YcaQ